MILDDKRVPILAIGICCAILIAITIPHFIASLHALKANEIVSKIKRGSATSPHDLFQAVQSYNSSARWAFSAQNQTDLGLVYLQFAKSRGVNNQTRRKYLLSARDSIEKGLHKAPANPYAWARLAFVEILLTGPSKKVSFALLNSIKTGKYEIRLRYFRIGLLLRVWTYLNEAERQSAVEQINLGANESMRTLALQAYRVGKDHLVSNIYKNEASKLKDFKSKIDFIVKVEKRKR